MEDEPEELMQHREAEMILDSSSSNSLILTRLAHFLIPIQPPNQPSQSICIMTCPRVIDIRFLSSMFHFRDYFKGDSGWKSWARKLHNEYELKWKEAGIYEAIGSSAYKTLTDADVIIAVAEKWCSETNTFMFPWGEATVTLEDVNVLGGFSVLGDCVNTPVQEVTLAEETLNVAFRDISSQDCRVPRTRRWMERFEGQPFEHEAFIALWLSRFVFPSFMCDSVNKKVFHIAVKLAKGHRIALAPAVLASVYRGLTAVKNRILKIHGRVLKVYDPLYLVQLWVWERFLELRPRPNFLSRPDVPRIALWNNVKGLTRKLNVRLALDTARESFVWRPYVSSFNGWLVHPLFKDEEQWISTDLFPGHVVRDVETFARCLRASELIGFGSFVQKYLPNRVAMQFGFDQDVPRYVHSENGSQEAAWRYYSRPLANTLIYIPLRNSKSCVTKKYLDWWRKSVAPKLDQIQGVVRKPRSVGQRRKRCYEKEAEEVYWPHLDILAAKEAKYQAEWSKKARLLREEPEEIDEGAATAFIHKNGIILDEVQDGILLGRDEVANNKDYRVTKARIVELEAINNKLVKRVSELEVLVDALRSEFLSTEGIKKVGAGAAA